MFLEVARLPVEKLMHRHRGECSADVRKRVEAAQARQIERWGVLNAGLSPADVTRGCVLSDPCTALLTRACERVGFSGRAFYGVIKVTRTIADLDGSEAIEVPHLAEAIQYRAGWERLRG